MVSDEGGDGSAEAGDPEAPLAPGPLLRIGSSDLQLDIAPQAGGRIALRDDDNLTSYNAGLFAEFNLETGSEDWLPFVEAGSGEVTRQKLDQGVALFRRVLKPYLRT